jgi:sarcosine oxidase gamma subunit
MQKESARMSEPRFNTALADAPSAEGLSIAMREVSDRGMIDLRGEGSSAKFKQAVKSVLGLDLPTRPRTSASKGAITVFWLSVDQWLITLRGERGAIGCQLKDALGSLHSLVVDVSDMRTIIRLEGQHVREVLMKGVFHRLHRCRIQGRHRAPAGICRDRSAGAHCIRRARHHRCLRVPVLCGLYVEVAARHVQPGGNHRAVFQVGID